VFARSASGRGDRQSPQNGTTPLLPLEFQEWFGRIDLKTAHPKTPLILIRK
jgi:hypothetical protein